MFIGSGFRTYDSPYPHNIPYPTYPYYLETDLWEYDIGNRLWKQIIVRADSTSPTARRGAASVLVPRAAGDPALLQFGGSRADTLMNDTWVLDVARSGREERVWRRLDTRWISKLFPPNTTFHSLNFDASSRTLFLFGGATWTPAETAVSDALTDADRRCAMQARSLLLVTCSASEVTGGGFANPTVCALSKAKKDIVDQCTASLSTFCCGITTNFGGISTLTQLSDACTTACSAAAFKTDYTLSFPEGLWVAKLDVCENACSGHGDCEFAICKCRPGWTGSDCSKIICPGSFCYIDSVSLEQHCVSCSSNGACDDTGACTCNPGWTGSDCATATIECGASGTLLNTEFPTNQCICNERFSGPSCSEQLCLNACNGRGNCTSGYCACQPGYYGDDCSVFLFTASANAPWTFLAVLLAVQF